MKKAYFAGGCFWCMEAVFDRLKGVDGVISGYAGGDKDEPTYEQVSHGSSGHAETIEVVYDPSKITYDDLLNVFFGIHDPTQLNRQGPDVGEQYRSVIFYTDEDQKKQAAGKIEELEKEGVYEGGIVTKVEPLEKFYEAEGHHQKYFDKHKDAAYCRAVISPKLAKLRKKFTHLVKGE